jgi:hypothetical protein
MITGAILLLAAEQAFAHTQLVQFPNHQLTRDILLPGSVVLALLGVAFLVWGALTDVRPTVNTNTDPSGSVSDD